ncbi:MULTISPECIES: MBL fold metallo-hydrolase [unclassified Gilvimarinus]|uniref:MBL fold metallo-hydrolase n=1 Tax=unclassified Gilvimarinus TaxID=2642066 RepID=UPI0026E2D8C1|nr:MULTISPECIES: MBL fold metallo-hydrolase [unclassified Gilvimarinus]MDO6572171.1 MBL fold metallo-hydrolase [Gilvimarinus sp. 2_MG-2023]MDO6746735.1 MBL fold metallo-hydrolase [Gilvimarinus sp. 1_MG-2023]
MLRIARFFLDNPLRNYNYFLLDEHNRALIIDPTDAALTLEYLKNQNLTAEAIWITHEDLDHIGGADEVSAQLNIPLWAPKAFSHLMQSAQSFNGSDTLHFAGQSFSIKHLQGHTPHHHVFYSAEQNLLISGDMLFNYGIGKVRQGQHQKMYESIQWLAELPGETVYLTAHDYDLIGLRFALSLQPHKTELHDKLAHLESLTPEQRPLLNIAEQRQHSPYFLLDNPEIHQALKQKGMPCDTPFAVFKSIRLLRDEF